MRSFTLNFWPGLLLAILLRVGPGLFFVVASTASERNFSSGTVFGIGLMMVINGVAKLWKELKQ